MNNIAIYLNSSVSNSLLDRIKEYYLDLDITNNVFVSHTNPIHMSTINTATISATHLDWMKGTIVFTTISDFLDKKDSVIAQCVLVVEKKGIAELTTKIIEEAEILVNEVSKLRKIKNAELQHLK